MKTYIILLPVTKYETLEDADIIQGEAFRSKEAFLDVYPDAETMNLHDFMDYLNDVSVLEENWFTYIKTRL